MTARNNPGGKARTSVVITRTFAAPRALVWKAWTEPEHFQRWWGPKNFTAPICKFDLRVGGKYHWCMRDADGKEYYTTGVFREIIEFERIVYTDCFADADGNTVSPAHYGFGEDFPAVTLVTVSFEEIDGKTKMTLLHAGLPAGNLVEMTGQSWNESFDKLAASLE